MMLLRMRNVLSAIFNSTNLPLLPSINTPVGQPRNTELKIEIAELRRICAPARYKLLPLLFNVAKGPMEVTLLNIAPVWGVNADPFASLSLSNDSELERSAISESRTIRPN